MLTDQLRSIPLFEGLTEDQHARVAECLAEVDSEIGTVLIREGEAAHRLFVVLEGAAVVTVDGEVVTMLRAGNTFGEIGLVEGGVRTATVVAVTRLRLLTMTAEEFDQLSEEIEGFGARAHALATARLERAGG